MTEIDFDSAARSSRLAAGLLTRSNGSAPPRTSRATLADHPELQQRIVEMHASGMTLQAIADTLNAEGVPTVRGGREWRPSSLYRALRRGHAARSR